MKMTNKQKAFISEYLVDLCATKAAIRAGYSAKRADAIGHENLRKPEIKTAIQLAMKQREERTQVTQERGRHRTVDDAMVEGTGQ